MRLTANETTGEHTCVMLRELLPVGLDIETKAGWLQAFTNGMICFILEIQVNNP